MDKRLLDHEHIVFGMEHYNPLGIVRSLGENGIRPIGIIVSNSRRITSKSKWLKKCHFARNIEEAYNILVSNYSQCTLRPFVYTSDDISAFLFDQEYESLKNHFYFFNAGEAGRLTRYMDKYALVDLAKKNNVPIAKTWFMFKDDDIPIDIVFPIITKSGISTSERWKEDTYICHNITELKNALKRIKSEKIIIQQYIKKKNELCIDGYVSYNGNHTFFGIASTYDYVLPKEYSHLMTVSNVHFPNLEDKIKGMFSEIGFEGVFSIEFLIGQNDELFFLEINFRNSTWSYAATCAGMPLPILWAEEILTGTCHEPNTISNPFKAMVEFDDFRSRVKTGKTSIFNWIRDFFKCKCRYYFVLNDLSPFFSSLTVSARSKIIKKIRGAKDSIYYFLC